MHFTGHSNRHIDKLAKRFMTCRYGRGRVALSGADIAKSKNIFGLKRPIRAPMHWSKVSRG